MVASTLSKTVSILVAGTLGVIAAPAPALVTRQTISALSSSQIAAFRPFTFFASTAYCQPSNTLAWNCGANCNANPGFVPVASGGDGSSVQFWYVGFDPGHNSVIVAHQGTDTSKIEALLTDANAGMSHLDASLFPGVPSSVEAHSGFASEQAKTAPSILAAVQKALSAHSSNQVTLVGHSLGAALALLDAVYLPLHLPGVSFKTVGYGMPRVGNQAFADYVDSHVTSLTRINNREDPVPILPGRFLGFHHPSGEVHIQDSGVWDSCPGQDNTSNLCTTGDVGNIFEGSTSDHEGPYDGVEMGC
ncbi:hypothetical protein HGRIS_005070 [Hohenbuehelia grisea]|uniref:Fungal lipase-type domain-containing protein n=1 Tax=Hohenbuehelia grisea TaxID=104357 RepID=A0ABR3JEU7_9AGAR